MGPSIIALELSSESWAGPVRIHLYLAHLAIMLHCQALVVVRAVYRFRSKAMTVAF
jgi:hypothetical protein